MKKLSLLLVALSLLLSSCMHLTPGTTAPVTTAADTTAAETVAPADTAYEEIERRPAYFYQSRYYGFESDGVLLELRQPAEWFVSKDGEGFSITRDGVTVGYLLGAPAEDTDAFTVLKTESRFDEDFCVTKYIERELDGTDYRYRYVYEYIQGDELRTVTLTAACAEVDRVSEEALYKDALTVEKSVSNTMGALSFYLGDPTSILILGNSFISTSKVGIILQEMLKNNQKDCHVEAVSRGYARVGTYAADESLLASLRAGDYDAVFICGFYGDIEISNLAILKAACEASGTMLVPFPAHNEGAGIVASAKEEYPFLFFLDWKAEIDTLIARGVDRSDMCINDAHDHSTPLAGYVGAHMIYRAIYGELPTEPMHTVLTQSYVDGKLSDYAYTGDGHIGVTDVIVYLD